VHVTPVKTAVSGFDEPAAQPAQPWDYSHGVTKAFEANRNNLSGSRGLRKFGVAIQRGASSPIKLYELKALSICGIQTTLST
jgi:hypothetical protein